MDPHAINDGAAAYVDNVGALVKLEAAYELPPGTRLYPHLWVELPTLPPELEDVMIEVLYPDFPGDPGPDVLMGSWAASRGWHSTPDGEPVLGKVLRWMPVPKGLGA